MSDGRVVDRDVGHPTADARAAQQIDRQPLGRGAGSRSGGRREADQPADAVPAGGRPYPAGQVVQRDPALLESAVEQPERPGLGKDPQAVEDGTGPAGDQHPVDQREIEAGHRAAQDTHGGQSRVRRYRQGEPWPGIVDWYRVQPGGGGAGQHRIGYRQPRGPVSQGGRAGHAGQGEYRPEEDPPLADPQSATCLVVRVAAVARLGPGEEPALGGCDLGQLPPIGGHGARACPNPWGGRAPLWITLGKITSCRRIPERDYGIRRENAITAPEAEVRPPGPSPGRACPSPPRPRRRAATG